MEGGRRRLTLYDQMLALGDTRELAGLTLNDVLTIQKRPSPNPTPAVRLNGRTLLDIIRDDVSKAPADHREKKSWKFLRDRLRLKRSLAAWTSSLEISLRNPRSQIPPRNSLRFDGLSSPPDVGRPPTDDMMPNEESPEAAAPAAPPLRHQISRRNSTRLSPNAPPPPEATNSNDSPQNTDAAPNAGRSLRAISRHHSTRFSMERSESFADLTEPARDGTRRLSTALAEERSLSAREAVAAQEAADAEATAEAAAAAAAAEEDEDEDDDEEGAAAAPSTDSAAPVRMSLMDLLEETDRQMGFEGSRYRIEEEEEEEEEAAEEAEEEREEEKETAGGGSGVERNCCVCMVRHKGAAFIPCGHTFCRLCSRELWVSRGNCPLCNGFILEILDIF